VPVTEQVETNQESDNTQAAVETTPTPQESFRQLREKAERAERERDEMRVALQKIYAQGPQTKQPEDDEDPSELIERRHLKRYESELTRVKEELSHTRQSIAEQHLKAQYPDFEKVVNRDTIEEFRSRNPKLAASLAATDDLFEKGAAVYTLIKNMGIYREDNYAPDRIKAENNAVKPKPTNSISPQRGESPLSHANAFANGLTDDLRKQLWREMDQARKAT
jgi:hypothetical protein